MFIFGNESKFAEMIEKTFKKVFCAGDSDQSKILTLTEQIEKLKAEKISLKESVEKSQDEYNALKKKKDLEEMEIKHLIRMKEEKNKLELEQEKVKMEKSFQDKTMELQKNNHEEAMKLVVEGKKDLQEIYSQILSRLPNVNMTIKQNS